MKPGFYSRFVHHCGRTLLLIAGVVFAFFTGAGLLSTCHVDIGYAPDNNEHVSFLPDSIALNLCVLLLLLALTYLLCRTLITRRAVYAAMGIVSFVTMLLGIWWVLESKAAPGADAKSILDAAQFIAQGNGHKAFEGGYFYVFPFQLGFLLYAEVMCRLFGGAVYGSMSCLNVLFVVAAYWAVLKTAMRLFKDPRAELLTALLLGFCMQPVFLCTFLYGVLPGLAFAAWSLYFCIAFLQEGKLWRLILCMGLLAVSIILKKNYAIFLIAEAVVLFIRFLRTKNWRYGVLLLGLILICMKLPAAVQNGYEERFDVSLGKGTPMGAWLVTGFRESSLCSGWFNSYTTTILMTNEYDQEAAKAQIRQDFLEQIKVFAGRPRYFASFMYRKVISQWNEPAFQSIWSSAAGERFGEVSPLISAMGTGEPAEAINGYFNQLMQYVYLGVVLGFILLFSGKGAAQEEHMTVPLILLGAVLYHALFEAKAQYALIYVPLIIPYCAYAYAALTEKSEAWINGHLRRKN